MAQHEKLQPILYNGTNVFANTIFFGNKSCIKHSNRQKKNIVEIWIYAFVAWMVKIAKMMMMIYLDYGYTNCNQL